MPLFQEQTLQNRFLGLLKATLDKCKVLVFARLIGIQGAVTAKEITVISFIISYFINNKRPIRCYFY